MKRIFLILILSLLTVAAFSLGNNSLNITILGSGNYSTKTKYNIYMKNIKRLKIITKLLMVTVLIIICTLNSYAQNKDSIIFIFNKILNQDKACLLNFRGNGNHTLTACNDKFPTKLYSSCEITLFNNSIIYGIDLSPKAGCLIL